jgi:hypothetical protein
MSHQKTHLKSNPGDADGIACVMPWAASGAWVVLTSVRDSCY